MELASARALGFQLISELYQQAQAGHLPPPLSKQPEAVHYSIRIRCSDASGIFPRLGNISSSARVRIARWGNSNWTSPTPILCSSVRDTL